jgi:translation initiation factor 2 alpha subunit (eIF-2alpha)
MVFQHFNLFPHLNIIENLALGPIWVRKVPKKEAEEIESIIRERIKPKQVTIEGELEVESYAENGVELVNDLLTKIMSIDEKLSATFLGAGRFKISVTAHDYKEAESIMEDFNKIVADFQDGDISTAKFERK